MFKHVGAGQCLKTIVHLKWISGFFFYIHTFIFNTNTCVILEHERLQTIFNGNWCTMFVSYWVGADDTKVNATSTEARLAPGSCTVQYNSCTCICIALYRVAVIFTPSNPVQESYQFITQIHSQGHVWRYLSTIKALAHEKELLVESKIVSDLRSDF